jgi:SNF2 family DNA or RNA helicase
MSKYGNITYDDKRKLFLIECAPHVSMRLKRVIGKLGVHSYGTHAITATDENARDLAWFLDRYPLEMNERDREVLFSMCENHKETERFVQDFYANGNGHLAFDLAVPARDYQKEAAALFLRMKGLLLADDVGLGKTISFIAALTEPATLPAVVVTLAHLPFQWEREINRFAPHLRTHVIKKGRPYKLPPLAPPDVFIINYHKLSGWAETLAPIVQSVCFDEAQELRREGSNKYDAAKHLARLAPYRIGLSATPIYNYGGEFFNVIDVLCPNKLGDTAEFYREWCGGGWYAKARIKNPKAFGAYLRDNGIMLRRTRREVSREIPEISKFHQTIDSDTEALSQVSNACAELARLILREDKLERGEKFRAAEEFSNILRQATGIAKAPYVANFVKLLVENGEKVVLYGWHRAVYDIWKDVLKEYNPVMFTGSESAIQKETAKEKFIKGDSQVLIISLRAGAGLDGLQYGCKTVVFGELDWSPGVHEQAIGRVARDGQVDPVMAYFLVSEEGSDPVVVDVLGLKKTQIEGVRNHDKPLFEKVRTDTNHIKQLASAFLNK